MKIALHVWKGLVMLFKILRELLVLMAIFIPGTMAVVLTLAGLFLSVLFNPVMLPKVLGYIFVSASTAVVAWQFRHWCTNTLPP